MNKIAVLAAAAGAVLLAQAAPFKDGDRVVFFGDSITHGVEADARIEMGAPFTDGAILQRGMSVPVWGRVAPRGSRTSG